MKPNSDGSGGKEPGCQCRRHKRCGFDVWVGKIPWRRAWQRTPVFLLRKSHGQRRLVGYSPWGRKELDATERLMHADTQVILSHSISLSKCRGNPVLIDLVTLAEISDIIKTVIRRKTPAFSSAGSDLLHSLWKLLMQKHMRSVPTLATVLARREDVQIVQEKCSAQTCVLDFHLF